ncbi:MAG: Ig-like domain-containing protein [Lachnospiraceae bacterium]|nr:Ig-like domain-containing protein [Lachnospiraceae bacterium]
MKKEKLQFFSWSKRTKRIMLAAVIGFVSLGTGVCGEVPMQVAAVETTREYPVSEYWLEPAKIHVADTDDALVQRGAALPSAYDARTTGWVTSVKDQGQNETCWAFSSIAAIECNLIKNGRADSNIDLSENQFAYFFYNRKTDRLGYTKGDYNLNLRGNYLNGGGTLWGSGLALATWAGVTTEEKSPYISRPADNLCYEADYSVRNVYIYEYDIDKLSQSVATIKQAILNHGAVATGINFDLAHCYNEENASYYYPYDDNSGNHAVTLVGWDDTYSRDKFVTKPSRNGAWIIKNSYGTEFGDAGYNYVSYEDASLSEMMAFEAVTKEEQYDNNYQHDGSANPAYSYNQGEWYANVFTAKGANGYNEEIKAVGVYTLSTNSRYEIQVYTGLTSAGKPTSGTKVFSSSVKGSLTDAGYQTIELPKAVSLTAGEKFSVLVKLTEVSGSNAYMGIDSTLRNAWINFVANTDKNQSFVKVGGKWYDLGKELEANARIKVYTDRTTVKSGFKLSTTSLGTSKGASEKLSLKTKASNVYRNVTWKSADKNVATVTQRGVVKGKTYGTTTITASFVGSSKVKKLTCKVTVGPSKLKGFTVSGGKKVKVKWKKNTEADGYEIYYSTSKNGTYKKMISINKQNKTSYSKKLSSGTFYEKVRPYKTKGSKKLYGSFTSVKSVKVR